MPWRDLESLKKYKSNEWEEEQGWKSQEWRERQSKTKWSIEWLRNREIKQIINKLNSINNLKTVTIMKKEMYVAPELEVLEVMVEKGFEGSTTFNPEQSEWG